MAWHHISRPEFCGHTGQTQNNRAELTEETLESDSEQCQVKTTDASQNNERGA
jgi:hypothetical protein